MRRFTSLLFLLVVASLAAFGQSMIQSFDSTLPDTTAVNWTSAEGANVITLTTDTADKAEGVASVNVKASLGALHQWGTYAQFGYTKSATETPWDISISDSVSIWIKVRKAPTHPEYMVLRIQFADRPTPTDDKEQWIYENAVILDSLTTGWVNLRVPLTERVSTGTEAPDATGFITPPSNWGGLTWNNKKFDRDKIIEWSLAIVTTGWDPAVNLPADSLEVSFDGFQRFGARAIPAIVFNGKDWTSSVTGVWPWGQSALSVEPNAGPVPNSNAVKWTEGNEWNNGWTGWSLDISPAFNLTGGWIQDSLHFQMKAEAGVGALRAQMESASGKRGTVFTPVTDNAWHTYTLALKDMVVQDGAPNFDSTAITKVGFMAEGTGIAGKVIYLTEIWTGNPAIDVIPPVAPTGIDAVGGSYVNVVTWNDVPNEPGVRYNVYYSEQPWDSNSVDLPTVMDVPPYNLPSALANHAILYPVVDHDVSLYYGVTAKDEAGNVSKAAVMTSPVTTTAKGVPTIATTAPAPFVADGDLSEWSGVTPLVLSVVSGTAHAVPNNPINGDADLKVKAYLAVDANNLYVAFDIDDDVVAVDTTKDDYQQDCPDLFIGLYDWRTKHHKGYTRGATPDYHLRFSKNRIKIDNDGGPVLMYTAGGNVNYSWTEKVLTPGYVVEARIPFTELAGAFASKGDVVFSPKEGMRIPIDFSINDRDNLAPTGAREGIMCYSTLNDDNSYQDMFRWSYTWIGNQATVGVAENKSVPNTYGLSQNYPNPFNPSTQIHYSLAKPGFVSLKVYDVLGREVAQLVNSNQEAGSHVVTFNSASIRSGLASGVFFYRIEAGSFVQVMKMMLVK